MFVASNSVLFAVSRRSWPFRQRRRPLIGHPTAVSSIFKGDIAAIAATSSRSSGGRRDEPCNGRYYRETHRERAAAGAAPRQWAPTVITPVGRTAKRHRQLGTASDTIVGEIMISTVKATKPIRAVGGFFAMALDTLVLIPRRPFAWREFLSQSWFVARVSLLPALMLALPFTVLLVFTFNIVLIEFGAADYSGTGAAFGTVTQLGPIVTVLVVAGAGATSMCADLGARTIREELDAMRVMGINPIQALVVPRVLAATLIAVLLSSVVILVGLVGGFIFSVFVQHVTPGAFAGGMTIITHLADVVIALIKAGLFGLAAGLIACYKGISVGGGPAGVGNAVNETVVYTFVALFAINIIASAVGIEATL
jgi:phospholipid/cholesterol/gamma-HCH transport system permease protein